MNNEQFLKAIFKDEYREVHVTSFAGDPNTITNGLAAWSGGRFKNYPMVPGNQYFTISLFKNDDHGIPRRRKNLYEATYCVVLDDVKEKLDMAQVSKLPQPSWILETSVGSEQWGYILDAPCYERSKIENLTDGLIENGLAPNGKDPGMKGVTRYVRLPQGTNGKKTKYVRGAPYVCRLLEWEPDRVCSLQALAEPFNVDLKRARREAREDGAALVPDHPLLNTEHLSVKAERSKGRYEITCPWVDEHTGAADNGAAMFTNKDGSLGFKCHHGACERRTGRDLIGFLEERQAGWSADYKRWQLMRELEGVSRLPKETEETQGEAAAPAERAEGIMERLRYAVPQTDEQFQLCKLALRYIETLDPMVQITHHKELKDIMCWTAKDLRAMVQKFKEATVDVDFFDETVYVAEQNQFYDRAKRLWYTPDAYQHAHAHLTPEARKMALEGGLVVKVDKADYAPKMPPVFKEKGVLYGNTWHRESEVFGDEGNCDWWLSHFDVMGWGDYKKHLLQWMAYTVRHPDQKINHAVVLGSDEGAGKDWLLYPLVHAMGSNHTTMSGEELLQGFNEYALNTKHLHVNELEPGNREEAAMISARIKPLAAAPPEKLRINPKGTKKVEVRNLLSVSMCTNDRHALKLNGQSRRVFALWSDLQIRNAAGELTPEWREYWREQWPRMKEDWKHCVWYLRNKVDISDFHPEEAPPVTSYLQELQKAPDNVLQF